MRILIAASAVAALTLAACNRNEEPPVDAAMNADSMEAGTMGDTASGGAMSGGMTTDGSTGSGAAGAGMASGAAGSMAGDASMPAPGALNAPVSEDTRADAKADAEATNLHPAERPAN